MGPNQYTWNGHHLISLKESTVRHESTLIHGTDFAMEAMVFYLFIQRWLSGHWYMSLIHGFLLFPMMILALCPLGALHDTLGIKCSSEDYILYVQFIRALRSSKNYQIPFCHLIQSQEIYSKQLKENLAYLLSFPLSLQ